MKGFLGTLSLWIAGEACLCARFFQVSPGVRVHLVEGGQPPLGDTVSSFLLKDGNPGRLAFLFISFCFACLPFEE